MRALAISSAHLSRQQSTAYLVAPASDSRSRQALEAVDAYLRRDGSYLAPPAASSRLLLRLGSLVEKLLK